MGARIEDCCRVPWKAKMAGTFDGAYNMGCHTSAKSMPGSYANIEGLSPWTKDKLSPEEYLRKEVVELNNGRLAMLACIGLWAQELVQHGQPVMFTLLERIATYEIPALFQEFHQ